MKKTNMLINSIWESSWILWYKALEHEILNDISGLEIREQKQVVFDMQNLASKLSNEIREQNKNIDAEKKKITDKKHKLVRLINKYTNQLELLLSQLSYDLHLVLASIDSKLLLYSDYSYILLIQEKIIKEDILVLLIIKKEVETILNLIDKNYSKPKKGILKLHTYYITLYSKFISLYKNNNKIYKLCKESAIYIKKIIRYKYLLKKLC